MTSGSGLRSPEGGSGAVGLAGGGRSAGVGLVGRAGELEVLEGLVAGVGAGVGGAVWVGGDPGIGKSALIGAGLAGVRGRGCQVYWATADEQSPVFPLQLLLEALGGNGGGAGGPDLGPVAAGRAEIAGLLGGGRAELVTPRDAVDLVAERLVALVHRLCAVSPVVLVLDDAQWADDASLGVLGSVSRALRQLPVLVVVAARSVPARAEVARLRAALDGAGAVAVDLGPVSAAEAAEMVRQLAGLPPGPALAGQLTAAGGNPLYLRELIDALVRESRLHLDGEHAELPADFAALPATLSAAIGLRLGFLPEPAMAVLRLAAVLGPVFSAADLGTVTGRGTRDLAEVGQALTAGVLTETAPGTLAFRHGLVHQTLYQEMPASLRAALHSQAAENLARADAPPERVAMQLLAAPPAADTWMIDWITRAAPALSRRAPHVAAQLLERARDGLSWQDPRREHLDTDLAMAKLMLGDNDQVIQLARPVLAGTRDPELAGRAAWTLGYALPRLGQMNEAIDITGQALARPDLPPIWSARLHARRATSLFAAGHYAAARTEAQQAETQGTQTSDRLALGYALYTLARLDIVDHRTITVGTDAMQRALAALSDEPHATDLRLQLMINLGLVLNALANPAEADRVFAQAAALVERGTPPRQAHVRAFLALHAFHRGRWDDALAELDAAAQLPLEAAFRQQYVCGVGAQVAFHRDDRPAADAYLLDAAGIQLGAGEVRADVEYLMVAWALAAERDGDPAEALTRLLAIFDPGATLKFPRLGLISTQWLPDVVRLALATGQPHVAIAAAEVCTREAETQAAPPWTAGARHCQGLLDRDPHAVASAVELLRSIGHQMFTGQALENAAVLYAEHGDTKAARTTYKQAIAIYSDLGAAWDIMRADTRLRRHNIRRGTRGTRQRPATGWAALTPTEQKIAHLIASGQSNPDIATQMFLSRYTVETHVSHILAKLNARSRFEIARAAAGQGTLLATTHTAGLHH